MNDATDFQEAVHWMRRTPAVAHMLNPAFLAAVFVASTHEFNGRAGEAMPYAYPYLIAPLLLHRQTRDALPLRSTAHLSKWVASNQVIAVGFPARAHQLRVNADEGLRFALRGSLLTIEDGGLIAPTSVRRATDLGDARSILAKATLIGRWFAQAGRPATVFALLGVTP